MVSGLGSSTSVAGTLYASFSIRKLGLQCVASWGVIRG